LRRPARRLRRQLEFTVRDPDKATSDDSRWLWRLLLLVAPGSTVARPLPAGGFVAALPGPVVLPVPARLVAELRRQL
jgi:hypothetical protein